MDPKVGTRPRPSTWGARRARGDGNRSTRHSSPSSFSTVGVLARRDTPCFPSSSSSASLRFYTKVGLVVGLYYSPQVAPLARKHHRPRHPTTPTIPATRLPTYLLISNLPTLGPAHPRLVSSTASVSGPSRLSCACACACACICVCTCICAVWACAVACPCRSRRDVPDRDQHAFICTRMGGLVRRACLPLCLPFCLPLCLPFCLPLCLPFCLPHCLLLPRVPVCRAVPKRHSQTLSHLVLEPRLRASLWRYTYRYMYRDSAHLILRGPALVSILSRRPQFASPLPVIRSQAR